MKILIAAPANSIHTVRWVNSLVSKGIDVSLAFLNNHGPEENLIMPEVKLFPLSHSGSKGYYTGYKEFKNIHSTGQYDLVHAHFASGYATLVRLSRVKPAILSVWGTDIFGFPNKSVIHKLIIKKNLRFFDRITSSSEVLKVETNKYVSKDIEVIPFGVDLKKFKYGYESHNKSNELVIVKTYLPNYGIKYLIKAVSFLVEKYPSISLDIFGKGPEEKLYVKLIEELKLNNNVFIKAYIPNDELPEILKQYDIFTLSSINESFGVSAVEAMAVGVPVIASDAVGFLEVMKDGETGVIVPKQNPKAMAEAIDRLLQDKDLRVTLSKKARKRTEELYDWEKNVNQMIKLYKGVCNV